MNDEKKIETTLPEDESLIDLEDMEDEELPPPEEENEAREINVGNIFAVILIGILILFLIAFIAVNANSKKKTKTDNYVFYWSDNRCCYVSHYWSVSPFGD